jgi:hypothetical protein
LVKTRSVFEDRAAIGYDHGYDSQKVYLGLALDPKYIEGFVEGCLERIGEERLFRDLWKDEEERETVLEAFNSGTETREGRPSG